MRARMRSGEKLSATVSQIRAVSGPMWIETVRYPIHGPSGEALGFRGISRDVTERWEAEAALRESEARYRGLVESQEALIFRAHFDGSLTFINEACRRKYGVVGGIEGATSSTSSIPTMCRSRASRCANSPPAGATGAPAAAALRKGGGGSSGRCARSPTTRERSPRSRASGTT